MERLTSEQIRLLEELRELRDAGILTIDEFEFQVAKVLGRPLTTEPSPVDEEPAMPAEADETVVVAGSDETQLPEQNDVVGTLPTPDTSHETKLLGYELVDSAILGQDELLVEENQVVEPSSTSDNSAANIAESETRQNNSSRRKVLIGTTVGLILIAVIALLALGGGKSDSTSSQIVDSTTTVTQSTMAATFEESTIPSITRAPVTSTQFVANTTTVARKRTPTLPTSPTTPTTTITNPVYPEPIVTDLRIAKSQPIFYKYPRNVQQTVTFTASILNDEQLINCHCGGGVRLFRKYPSSGDGLVTTFELSQPGIWKLTLTGVADSGFFDVGLNEVCVVLTNGNSGQCSGPMATFEILEQETNPPNNTNDAISPG